MKKIRKQILIVTDHISEPLQTPDDVHISFVHAGEDAIEVVQRQSFDLILLDEKTDPGQLRKMKAILPFLTPETEIMKYVSKNFDELKSLIRHFFIQQQQSRLARIVVTDPIGV